RPSDSIALVPPDQPELAAPSTASTAARSSSLASASGITRSTAALRPHRFGDLLDPDRAGLELGRPGLRVGGVDREDVGVDLIGEVEGHEDKAGAEAGVEPSRDLERTTPRGHSDDLTFLDPEVSG